MRKYAIGADVGGSHISCAVIDLETKTVVKGSASSQKVDNKASAEEVLGKWASALNHSIQKIDKSQLAGIGFAMPGPFDYANGIALFTHEVAKFEKLYGVNVAAELKKELNLNGESDVRFMNDATAFAVGEAWFGKAAGVERSLSITLGTGFGSAFVENGVPVVEREDVPKMGCVWHLPFKDGIADDYFSTRWNIRRYAEISGHQASGVKEIADRVATDASAKEVFVELGQNLGEFLGPWLKKFDAKMLVIGGNVSGAYNLFGGYFEEKLAEQNVKTVISISELKEDAALVGSARLFENDFWNHVKPLLSKM
ncbi:MAG: ROK family protein [Bacteroidota bacterium]|nr:ROK family protein [Bacteroidota bacterium]